MISHTTTLYSTSQAAAVLSERRGQRISRWAVRRAAIKYGIGSTVGASFAYTSDDLDRLFRLIPGKSGNPNMTSGNELWRHKKEKTKSAS